MTKKRDKRSFIRKRGNRKAVESKRGSIHFSWQKIDVTQGQSIKEWEEAGLLSVFCERMRQIGGYLATQAIAEQLIKNYTKVGYPPKSKFKEPKHVSPGFWSVIHIKPKSKEVVAGYLEDNIFYIVFLDKDHHFWPTDIQTKGKKWK